jgi:single-stranded DNA-binding protein
MNSCVLLGEIVKAPELRYTQDGQMAISEMVIQFPGLRAEDPMEKMKVVGWGNLAQQIQEQFQEGDQVIVEGRLTMALLDRPEGFKEKRAELTAGRIHRVQADLNAPRIASTPSPAPTASSAPAAAPVPAAKPAPAAKAASKPAASAPAAAPAYEDEPNYDDIPF